MVFFYGVWSLDTNSAEWEDATGLAFSVSKMANKMAAKMTEI